jgi:hypothetical protein
MNTLELSQAIGKTGLLSASVLSVRVTITDAKIAYGNVRYLVTPVSGTGSVWVDSSRVSFENSKEEKENAIRDKK